MIKTEDIIGAKVIYTFIDRGSNLVIGFEQDSKVGVEPNWRYEKKQTQIRIKPDGFHHLTVPENENKNN
jgi:hypothetical protein